MRPETAAPARPAVDPAVPQRLRGPLLRKAGVAWLAVVLVCGALFPFMAPNYLIAVATTTLVFVLLGHAVGAIYTYLRLLMFGVGGFYALGAYTVVLGVGERGWPLALGILVATVLPGVVALIVSPVVFRLKGIHFALITFALAELFRSVIVSWQSLTGGWSGISLKYEGSVLWFVEDHRMAVYWVALAAVALTTAGFFAFRHSATGLRAIAIGDDPSMARALGVSPQRFQYGLFALSAMLCGFAGALITFSLRFIDPSVFSATHALAAVTALIIGGWRIVPGPMLGAIAVVFLPDLLDVGPLIAAWIYGGGLILAITLFPDGIGGTVLDRYLAHRRRAAPPAGDTDKGAR
ncbi:branched-chain amino acid ABC transporter permease [Variovorax paradoxus]|nr:branched-chain amino acid ABC transporter permease [Variovorax paradoxus]MBT2301960.1 branched-chain amino acid ABC transporter permease [Variovorax paradoxus]